MRQYSETYTTIEMRRNLGTEWEVWHKPLDGIFRPAEMLAYQGRLIEAIESAETAHIQEHGSMWDVEFRCVTRTTTITAKCPLHDGWATP